MVLLRNTDHPVGFNYGVLLILGFCGKIYPIIEVQIMNKDREIVKRNFAYNYQELLQFQNEKINYYNRFPLSRWYVKQDEISDFPNPQKSHIKQFFQDWSWQDDKLFLQHKVPIWVRTVHSYYKTGTLNPKLKDYGFERIKDSFTAFQEISMYLSNILVEQKEIAQVEDKYRIEQHGFDLKKSFRKEKNKS